MNEIKIIDRGRGPELAHYRATVFDVLHYMEAGRHHTFIAAVLGISSRDVKALQQYIEDHKDEVMAMHRKIEERIAKGNPPEIEERLKNSPYHAIIEQKMAEMEANRQRESNGESDRW